MWIISEIINTIANYFLLKKKSKKGKKITNKDLIFTPTLKILIALILFIILLKVIIIIIVKAF